MASASPERKVRDQEERLMRIMYRFFSRILDAYREALNTVPKGERNISSVQSATHEVNSRRVAGIKRFYSAGECLGMDRKEIDALIERVMNRVMSESSLRT